MSTRPYLKLYVANYIADTRQLDLDEHGAYLLILFELWRRDGEIPSDRKSVARLIGTSPAKFEKVWPAIEHYFEIDEERATLSNARLTRELELFREKSSKAARAGSKGGAKRVENLQQKQTPEKTNAKRNQADASKQSSYPESEIESQIDSPLPPKGKIDLSTVIRVAEHGGKQFPITLGEALESEEAGDMKNPAYALPEEIRRKEVWAMCKGVLALNGVDQKAAGTVIGEMAKKHQLDADDLARVAVIVWRAAPRSAKPYFVSVCERIALERRN